MLNTPAIRSCEERRLDAVESENLFGDSFVLGQEYGVRPGARIAQAKQVKIGDDVHLLGVVAVPGFGEIEKEVDVAAGERVQRRGPTVQFNMGRFVAELLQRF